MTQKGVSKIKTQLSLGANVTIPRNYVDYIVTEYGVARMRGRSVMERTMQMIQIAHPDVRDETAVLCQAAVLYLMGGIWHDGI